MEPKLINLGFVAAQIFRERKWNIQRLNLGFLHKFEMLLGQ
jgi:hypothetical protein